MQNAKRKTQNAKWRWRLGNIALAVIVLLMSVVAACADDDDDDDEPQLTPGVVGHYDGGGCTCVRRDAAVQFIWGDRSPDERLPPGDFSARWDGQLYVVSPGKHRFYLYAAGQVVLQVAGKTLLSGQSDTPRWFDSAAIELDFGHQPLTIEFKKTGAAARVGLYWSGPQFELEPVSGRLLFHDPADDPGDAFGRGAELWRALRCGNCHNQTSVNRPHPNPLPKGEGTNPPTASSSLRAPSLAKLSGNLSRGWLMDWLADDAKPTPSRRMPHLGVPADEAAAIADYLLADAVADTPVSAAKGDVNRGRQLFITLGCLACHQLGDLGAAGLFGGGALSHVADKRPSGFFARWLRDPASINADHRMPVFRLSDGECDDLAVWLATLRRAPPAPSHGVGKKNAVKGKQLVELLRCGNCHALPDESPATQPSPALAKLLAQSKARDDWSDTCLGSANRDKSRPGYKLPTAQSDALIAYLAHNQSVPRSDAPSPQPSPRGRGSDAISPQPSLGGSGSDVDGRFVLRERNCLACHARDTTEGIAPTLAALVQESESEDALTTQLRGAAAEMNLASLLPLLAPPALTGVGDKLLDAALDDAITLRHPPLRPWLAIRMPRFNLSAEELAALTDHLATIDRIPDRPRVERPLNPKSLTQAGARLVTSKGFGCTSCHQIGHSLPGNVALAAHGSDLSLVGRRVRRPWFDRWVHNPARIVPRMEMPAIQMPVRGVLADKLDNQLAAVWQVLNTPGFEPPPTGPIRVARHPGDDSPPVVVTDVVQLDRQVLLRPVMIGLSNRHNLLFDLSGNRLAGWWLGDTANQLTVGKSWHWEPAGFNLLEKPAGRPEVELLAGERTLSPDMLAGTSLSELDWLETTGESAMFGYRLQFIDDGKPIVVQVTQQVAPLKRAGTVTGFRRGWTFRVPLGYTVHLRDLPADVTLERRNEQDETLWQCEAIYTTPDQPPAARPMPELLAEPAAALSVVPGYEAVRLPLVRGEMPTGLAWRDDGTLSFCSLKGGVWLARDTDGDSLEDRLSLVADGLPAPYGIAC
ncbi:MAG TPA: c-type cytochrome, partial [Pirellulales bacterium]